MDSPSQRQTRLAYADAPSPDTQAFPHGSSADVRTGLPTPSDSSLEKHPSERRHTRLSLGTDEEPDAMAEGDSPFAQIFNRILRNPQDPLHTTHQQIEMCYLWGG